MSNAQLTSAIADLRHLYANLTNGTVRDTASAKRIAEGILSRAIQKLETVDAPLAITTEMIEAGYEALMEREPKESKLTDWIKGDVRTILEASLAVAQRTEGV